MKTAKKRRGRPKGSRNKPTPAAIKALATYNTWKEISNQLPDYEPPVPIEPAYYLSRLEAATIKYEQAINDAIGALKGN